MEEFAAGAGAEAFSYKRQYFDSDVSYSLMPFTALRLGYSRETDKRTFREFEHDGRQHLPGGGRHDRMELPAAARAVPVRAPHGSGLDEEVFDAENEGFARPRQFDISDRNRNRFTFLVTGTPNDTVSVNAQVGLFREKRPDTEFGLVNTDGNFYSLGVDVTPMQKVAMGLTWGFDEYKSFQRSRQANPGVQETNPTRDWTTDVDDHANSIYAYLDLLQMLAKTDIRYAFDWMDGLNDTTYGLRPDQTIFTTVPLIQLPNASHTLTRSSLTFMYRVSRRFGAGCVVVLRELRRERLGVERLRRAVRERQRHADGTAQPHGDAEQPRAQPGGAVEHLGSVLRDHPLHVSPVRRQYLRAARAGLLLVGFRRGGADAPSWGHRPGARALVAPAGNAVRGGAAAADVGGDRPEGAGNEWQNVGERRVSRAWRSWRDGADDGGGRRWSGRQAGRGGVRRAEVFGVPFDCGKGQCEGLPRRRGHQANGGRDPGVDHEPEGDDCQDEGGAEAAHEVDYPNLPKADVDALVAYLQTLKK